MRVYADENVWKPVVTGLRRRGWDISSVFVEGTTGDSDREHIERAAANDWVLLTFDDDFLSLAAEPTIDHAGIIYIEQSRSWRRLSASRRLWCGSGGGFASSCIASDRRERAGATLAFDPPFARERTE